MNINNFFASIKKDFQLSFRSEKELNFENYQRISSKLTVLHRYITAPALIVVFIKMLVPTITSTLSRSILPSERWGVALDLIPYIAIVVFLLYFICLRLLITKHVFFNKKNNSLLIFLPYRNRMLTVDRGNLKKICGSFSSHPKFVSLKIREKDHYIKFYFLGKIRFLSLPIEHPIVREIEGRML